MERKKDFKETLLNSNLLTQERIKALADEAKSSGTSLINVIYKNKAIDDKSILQLLEEEFSIPSISLSSYLIDPKIVELVPQVLVKKYNVIPVFVVGKALSVAMSDPFDIKAIDDLRHKTGYDIQVMAAPLSELNQAISQYYGISGSLEDILSEVKNAPEKKSGEKEDLLTEDAPIAKLVTLIIIQAVQERASDIHIEPEDKHLRIRYRIDGVLHETSSPPAHLQAAIISRIKVMSGLDIAESRLPQDGRFSSKFEGREIDVRVSTYPTVYGEAVVMRLLDKQSMLLSLEEFGFSEENYKLYESLITRPHGIILVTGPTGSGKTTTLYSTLNHIKSSEENIMTIEDPVEYELSGIRQSQVNVKAGYVFASALRSILRQDPDIILVGEIRDFETAGVAVEAALTGHLVFSTLHTNDAPGALTRLTDMGVEPFLTSSATAGVLAQRLVRKICDNCKEELKVPTEVVAKYDYFKGKKNSFYHGKGCKICKDTGYKGRIGIFELFVMNEEIRQLVIKRSSTSTIKEAALKSGMKTLRDDGLIKVSKGVTTLDEVLRVTELD